MSSNSAAGDQVTGDTSLLRGTSGRLRRLPAAVSLSAMAGDQWLARAAARRPDRVAIEAPGARLTYAELSARAQAGAASLGARGVRPGDRVALALPAGVDFAVALHACLALGAAAMPVDLRLGEGERAAQVARAAAVVEEPL